MSSCCILPVTLFGLGVNYLSRGPVMPATIFEFDKTTGARMPLETNYWMEIAQLGQNLAADTRGRLFNVFSAPSADNPAEGPSGMVPSP